MKRDERLMFISDHFGRQIQLAKYQEECLEAIEAAQDYMQKGATPETLAHLIEEVADVEIMSAQIRYLFHIDQAVDLTIQQKLDRTISRINSGFYSK